jgi:hypothetical protein
LKKFKKHHTILAFLLFLRLVVNDTYTYLLTYLCGTTTNIWLRPVEKDLFMTACLGHSASNL